MDERVTPPHINLHKKRFFTPTFELMMLECNKTQNVLWVPEKLKVQVLAERLHVDILIQLFLLLFDWMVGWHVFFVWT